MPNSIIRSILRDAEPLSADEPVAVAARKVLESDLPALPAVDEDGKFVGIFGEREFMAALFPGYMKELHSAAMVKRSIDETIERRESCRREAIREHLTTDHVTVNEDFSDTQLVEIFLHHRVLVVPVLSEGRITSVVTRADFFAELVAKFESAG